MEDRKPIIALFVCILLLGISNITNVAVSKAQKEQIKNLEIKVTEINDEKEKYREEVKNLEKQLKLIENNVNDVKKQTDQIADKLVEVNSREDTQEELKISTEEVVSEKPIEIRSIPAEEITTEKATTEEEIADIPWVVYEVVECEVHGGDKESKMHVAHVIRNRVNSDLFPNDYYSVCTSPNQFCTRSDVEQSTIDAVNEAMATGDTTGGALFFHSMGYSDSFNGYGYIFTDNVGHHFYGIKQEHSPL